MTRSVPARLQEHLNQQATTTCRLLKLELQDGTVYGMTSLDVDVEYDGVVYRSRPGLESSIIATDVGLSVDNGEGVGLTVSNRSVGITVESLQAGDLDDAQWSMMLVNYRDLSMGHVLLDAGDTGEVKISHGMSATIELVSFAMRLRQPIGTLDSRTCRATFGAPQKGQYGCGVDADALWIDGVVTSVSSEEPRRIFFDGALVVPVNPVPGRIQWVTGNNSTRNRLYQIEQFDAGSGGVAMLEITPYDIQAGDQFRIRQDCDKLFTTCRDDYNNLLNFRGEPYIPVGSGIE